MNSPKMILPYVPNECIYDILKYLRNDRSTLFNCLLVDRFWCKVGVPFLYLDPFGFPNKEKIVWTLILCFDKTDILQLKDQLTCINSNNNIIINDEDKPLFNYLKYVEYLDCTSMCGTIIRWFKKDKEEKYANFFQIFYQSIFKKCTNIKQLGFNNRNYKIGSIQILASNLKKLSSLTLHVNRDKIKFTLEFLKNIQNICLDLRKLEIIFTLYGCSIRDNDIRKNVCMLIQKQNNLRIIKLYELPSYFQNSIFSSLEFQKDSLVYIEFNKIHFNNNDNIISFTNLYNLKYLKFQNCVGLSLDQCEILKYSSFKLKRLHLTYNSWRDDDFIMPLMIEYLGPSLEELILNEPLTIPILENISIYCLNIITLEIEIESNIDSLYLNYFKNLNIKVLVINDCYYEMLQNLANNLPINVKEIFFGFSSPSKIYKLKIFLENCHNYLKIIHLDYYSIELALLKIILDYIKRNNNRLKFLSLYISPYERVLDEELKLLDQIKTKGVKIVNSYNIVYKKELDRLYY